MKFKEAHQEILLTTQPVQVHRKLSLKCSFTVTVLSLSPPLAIVSNKNSPNPGPSPFWLAINDMATSQRGKQTLAIMTSIVVILIMIMIIFNMIISFYLPSPQLLTIDDMTTDASYRNDHGDDLDQDDHPDPDHDHLQHDNFVFPPLYSLT